MVRMSAVGADNKCAGMDQATLKAALAIDTYQTSGVARDLTLAECSALATGATASVPSDSALAADAEASMPNGGASFVKNGPTALCDAANAKLVLALSHPSSASCKWWRIAVECP